MSSCPAKPQVSTKQLHSTDSTTFLQNEVYSYNERGWLRTSTSGLNGTNLLTLDLRYNTPDAGSAKFNGNITEMLYAAPYSSRTFYYTYDPLNRLNSANSGAGNTVGTLDESIAYDNMGNITSLTRTGSSAATLTYSYLDGSNNNTNQLHSVQNAGVAYRTYLYDLNGNATSDGGTKIINYNLLDLPQTLTQSGSTLATYIYDTGGSKLRTVSTTDGTWDYISGVVYKNGALSFIQTEEGKALWNGSAYQYQYNLKDHLGNVRVTFTKNNTTGLPQELQEDEYYAFGLSKLLYDNSNGNRYLYNGKELQVDLANQYDYGARFYDPVIARWTTPDPLAEFMRRHSPYEYALNNPIRFIDPTGMAGKDTVTNLPCCVVVTASKPISVASKVGNFIIENLPFVGSGTHIYEGIRDGDWKKATLGTIFLAVDVFTAGEGGEGLKLAEEGIEEGIKLAEVYAEDELKEGA